MHGLKRPAIAALGVIAVFAAPAGLSHGQDRTFAPWMSAADLRQTFSGRQVSGHYRHGMTFIERYLGDGRVQYEEAGGRAEAGAWSIEADSFCTLYETSPSGACFLVIRQSSNCYAFYSSASTRAAARSAPRPAPSWTARVWIDGSPSTCIEAEAV